MRRFFVCGVLVTLTMVPQGQTALAAIPAGCRCIIHFIAPPVPAAGGYPIVAANGSAIVDGQEITTLDSISVQISLSDAGGGFRNGTVTSATGNVGKFSATMWGSARRFGAWEAR